MALDPKVRMLSILSKVQPDMRYGGGDLAQWQAAAREKLASLTGYDKCERTEANFRVEWSNQEEGYTETRFLFETEPEVTSIGHILIPDGTSEKLPLIICLQGHSKGMHVSLGRVIYESDIKGIAGNRDTAIQAVKKGFIALALEQRGFGQRGGTDNGPACHQPAMQALMTGRTLIGQRCWDVSRAIDVVQEHFPMVDMNRIAITGNSGGGTCSVYSTALDTRIAAAMPSCAVCGYKESIGELNHCVCNYIPGISNHFDMGDLVAMAAPRPYVVVSGTTDGIFPLASAKEQVEIGMKAYEAAVAGDKLRHVVGPEGHRYYAALCWPVFDEITGWAKK